jgi:hypothetical protein
MKESLMRTRELHHRVTPRVTVEVFDEAVGESFELEVPRERALDAFYHPFAYAAFDGVLYTTRTREPVEV